jgi:hypothetical protein
LACKARAAHASSCTMIRPSQESRPCGTAGPRASDDSPAWRAWRGCSLEEARRRSGMPTKQGCGRPESNPLMVVPRVRTRGSDNHMRTTFLVLCLTALATPSQAAQKPKAQDQALASREQMCRAMVGKGPAYARQRQRLRDCIDGKLPVVSPHR